MARTSFATYRSYLGLPGAPVEWIDDDLLSNAETERREFHAPGELAQPPQKVVIACPGYGARALWRDGSIVPVRGQTGWLIPRPEVRYGFYYRDVGVLSRRDGIVVQALDGGDMNGYDNADETPGQRRVRKRRRRHRPAVRPARRVSVGSERLQAIA